MPRFWAMRSAAPNWSGMSHGKCSGRELPGPLKALAPEADAAHRLDAAGNTDVDGASGDQVRDEVVGLLGRPALAVDGGRGDLIRQAWLSQAVRVTLEACSPAWVTQPPITCSTVGGVDAGPLYQLHLGRTQQLGSMQARPSPRFACRSEYGLPRRSLRAPFGRPFWVVGRPPWDVLPGEDHLCRQYRTCSRSAPRAPCTPTQQP